MHPDADPTSGPVDDDAEVVEVRLNADDSVDEIVADRAFVHLEQMDDNQWFLVVGTGNREVRVMLSARGKISAQMEEDHG